MALIKPQSPSDLQLQSLGFLSFWRKYRQRLVGSGATLIRRTVSVEFSSPFSAAFVRNSALYRSIRRGREKFWQKLFLIQTLKWPLDKSAGSLSPQIRKAIRHSVEAHLSREIYEIRPRGIFASGAAAGLACCLLAPHSGLCEFFAARAFEEEVVGSRIEAEFPQIGCIPVYFSHLLVDRFQSRVEQHVQTFLQEMLETAGNRGQK